MKASGLMVGIVFILAAGIAVAQPVTQVTPMVFEGTQSLHLSGRLDDDGDDIGLSLSGRGGIFIQDFFQVGLFLSGGFRGSDYKTFGAGGFAEYSFYNDDPLVPYVGASLGLNWMDIGEHSDTYLELQGYGGVRYFFVNHAAVGLELVLKAATDDVYNKSQDAFDWVVRLVTTFFF